MKQNLYAEGIRILGECITINKKMRPEDIKTIGDIDIYRTQQAINGQTKSRYQTMIDLYGTEQADTMMRELEVRSWK